MRTVYDSNLVIRLVITMIICASILSIQRCNSIGQVWEQEQEPLMID